MSEDITCSQLINLKCIRPRKVPSINGWAINRGNNNPANLKYSILSFEPNILKITLAGSTNNRTPAIVQTLSEKRNRINKRLTDATEELASEANLVQRLEKLDAHIVRSMVKVFLMKEYSPNSIFVSVLVQ